MSEHGERIRVAIARARASGTHWGRPHRAVPMKTARELVGAHGFHYAARVLGIPTTTLRRAVLGIPRRPGGVASDADREPAPLPAQRTMLRMATRLMRADKGEVLRPAAFADARAFVKLLRLLYTENRELATALRKARAQIRDLERELRR